MQVKVFEAPEMSTALKKVKETLGPNALILSTRTIRRGGMGVFSKPVLEVTAAIDDGREGDTGTSRRQPAEEDLSYRDLWRERKVIDPLEEELQDLKQRVDAQDLSPLKEELAELKALFRHAEKPPTEASPAAGKSLPAGKAGHLQTFRQELEGFGVAHEIAGRILDRAEAELTGRQLRTGRARREFLLREMEGLVQVTGPLSAVHGPQQRLALVGPTGVGKTTTAAKLAADYLERSCGSVALVTIDTYRIAAVEQLRIYGEIMDVPVEVVVSPEELQTAFDRHADKDLILVDTAGRSPRDDMRMKELGEFLGPESGTRNLLVLAAPTREKELQETVRRFTRLPLGGLVFTKLDECDDRGCLLNVPALHHLPVSYLTNGQRVPEDLLGAETSILADFITGRE